MTNQPNYAAMLALIEHIASFQLFSEAHPDADYPKDICWLENDSADLERLVLAAREIIKGSDQ